MEQQYTCPFCHQDYTRFTIAEHYGCGVEPLETTEKIEEEHESPQFTAEEVESSETEQSPAPKKRGRKPKSK